ncbi:MAG TPA: ATP-binding protein, partial [Ktedonobacteraceae bacterium]|nr:ATP-binding protein [Ktedonobacteraceae bacterium]
MHDRTTEHGDFQTIVNAFTQGLRELPTDYAARVKNFLAEYLGNLEHPVPFGGRTKDFERLDDWLTDTQAPPNLLLAAPAGRGKSALLVHWCRRLLARRDLAVVYFPVSIRFRTNLAGVTFPSLVALLAKLHGEQVPADPNTHEEVWRGLFLEYITRPLADGRPLVLVLDGVDEAADWVADIDLFPLKPPPGLRIVLSARYLANDQDANAWLKRLGWLRQGLARTLELYPLDRTGIASVLVQMGFPLDLLSTRVNIVSELYRLSGGDPLLVRLYVDDLWERGEAAMRFQPEDLRAIRPGLAGYFERWWKDQRLLWSKEAPQCEAAAQIVLNLLAGALGPLSKQDILNLLP